MHEYRQALMRLRQGDSEREIARSGLMGRAKAARFRTLAQAQGWLEPSRPLPPDAEIAAALAPPRLPASAQSALAAYRPLVERWLGQGVSGVAIHAALVREHGFTGHYSSVRRLIGAIGRDLPPDTTVYVCHDYPPTARAPAWQTSVAAQRAHNVHVRDGISEADFVAMRTARDKTLAAPTLLLPSLQVNIRAGALPPASPAGHVFLKLPVTPA